MSDLLTDDFRAIVLNNTDLLDVRADIEFVKGAFKNTTNLPILSDEERHLVGTEYKKNGNAAAVALAEELIKEEGKQQRVKQWLVYLETHPDALLYCFRGGQRSGIAQAWLKESGRDIVRLKGGYKAFRTFLMDESLRISKEIKTIIIGGYTGSGKTILLNKIKNSIDLEGIANHKGSSFGNNVSIQPSQINFENNLAYELIKFESKKYKEVVIEHESHNIGRAFIPKEVYTNLMDGEMIILERAISERVNVSYDEYVVNAQKDYVAIYGNDGVDKWVEEVSRGLSKIKKRLGDENYTNINMIFTEASNTDDTALKEKMYKEFIKALLEKYYDPMYQFQLEKSIIPVLFKGSEEEIIEFLQKRVS
ncbi:tRNA 2-selenouridine(34) synthase MnmH [Sulfurimonas sp. SAG-AH-194-C21]|nr:tRNA 2-selenouridine(34) synthase MnmH [Sulfurimonas sp. SAG-AH-194-C21]MDF1884347.1 tRNA 2-selenouridine(34) synthase MnmH [Sulfurimonas sp. SAG-AH-194-C21]